MKKRGMTLAETLIVVVLMAGLAGIIFVLVMYSGEQTAVGTMELKAQELGRLALETITGEMNQAQLLPRNIAAAIIYPDLATAEVKNRLIFAVSTLPPSDPSFSPFDLNSYRFVEYTVSTSKEGKAVLLRNIYSLSYSGSPTGIRGVNNKECTSINLSAFSSPEQSQTILELPEKGDTMELSISHPIFAGSSYSPTLYNIKITLSCRLPGKANKKTTVSLESQVWLKTL